MAISSDRKSVVGRLLGTIQSGSQSGIHVQNTVEMSFTYTVRLTARDMLLFHRSVGQQVSEGHKA